MTAFLCAIGALILGQFAMWFWAWLAVCDYKDGNVKPLDKALPFALLGAALGLAFYAGGAQ